jgi:ribosome-binding factor A
VKSYSRSRVTGETVREIVAAILLEDVSDPRVEFVTVTGVTMSPDCQHANVFVTAHGGLDRYREVLAGLKSAKGRIRTRLGQSVRMRYVPDLHFMIDPSVDEAARITSVIAAERAAGRAADDAEGDAAEAAADAKPGGDTGAGGDV